jgi:hypothetical protein
MKQILSLILISSIFIHPAFADQAIDLKQGQIAPYDGILLDKEKANKVKNELIEKDGLKQDNTSLNKQLIYYKSNEDMLNQKSDMLLKQNLEMTKSLNEARSTSNWEKIGFFVLGVVVTGAAAYGVSRITR